MRFFNRIQKGGKIFIRSRPFCHLFAIQPLAKTAQMRISFDIERLDIVAQKKFTYLIHPIKMVNLFGNDKLTHLQLITKVTTESSHLAKTKITDRRDYNQ